MQAGLPQDFGLSLLVEIPRQHEQEVGEAIGVFERGRVHRLLIGDFGHMPFRPADDGAGMMQVSSRHGCPPG